MEKFAGYGLFLSAELAPFRFAHCSYRENQQHAGERQQSDKFLVALSFGTYGTLKMYPSDFGKGKFPSRTERFPAG